MNRIFRGAATWWRQGVRQLARHWIATSLLTGSAAATACLFAILLLVKLLLAVHVPGGTTESGHFLTLGVSDDRNRHLGFGLDHLRALRRQREHGVNFFAANVGSSYELIVAGERRRAHVGFASEGFLPALGVTLIAGQWPPSRNVTISKGLAEQLFGSAENALGRSVRLADANFNISGVIDDAFTGLQPDWENGPRTQVWAPAESIFAASGFDRAIPREIQLKARVFQLYAKVGKSLAVREVGTRVTSALKEAGLSEERWVAERGIFLGLAQRDALDRLVAPAGIALVGMVLTILLSLVAHETRTLESRTASVRLRKQLGGRRLAIVLQEVAGALPLCAFFLFAEILFLALFFVKFRADSLDTLHVSGAIPTWVVMALMAPMLLVSAMPLLSRLLFLFGLASNHGLPLAALGISKWMFASALSIGLPAASLMIVLGGVSSQALQQVGKVARETSYLIPDRLRGNLAGGSFAEARAMTSMLRAAGIEAAATSSAPFAMCDESVELRLAGNSSRQPTRASFVGVGTKALDLLDIHVIEGRAPAAADQMVMTRSLARALGVDLPGGTTVTSTNGSKYRVVGIAEDGAFEAQSIDNPARAYVLEGTVGCPYFIVARGATAYTLRLARKIFEGNSGVVRVSNRARLAYRALYAEVLLGKVIVGSAFAVGAISIYLLVEALRSYLFSNRKKFATMIAIGAQTHHLLCKLSIWLLAPMAIGTVAAFSIAYALWTSFNGTGLMDARTIFGAMIAVGLVALSGLFLSALAFLRLLSNGGIALVLKEE